MERVMKKFLLIVIALLIAAGVLIYSDPQLKQDSSNMLQRLLGAAGVDTKSTSVYKWKDANGVLQYTQQPPPEGTAYEEVEARTDVNVLPLPDELKK